MSRPPPAPDRSSLHDAAIRHLARYASTTTGLLRVLSRRIDRWARATEATPEAAAAAQATAQQVVAALVQAGVLNDTQFAAIRAASLTRAGRSRRAIAAHLAQRGIDAETAQSALPDSAETELAAALLLARKRRLGPFGPESPDRETRLRAQHRALGILARAGFSQDTARRALNTETEEAETRILQLRRD